MGKAGVMGFYMSGAQHLTRTGSVPLDDPLLRVDEYRYDGAIGPTTDLDIDSTVCGV